MILPLQVHPWGAIGKHPLPLSSNRPQPCPWWCTLCRLFFIPHSAQFSRLFPGMTSQINCSASPCLGSVFKTEPAHAKTLPMLLLEITSQMQLCCEHKSLHRGEISPWVTDPNEPTLTGRKHWWSFPDSWWACQFFCSSLTIAYI